MNSAVLTNGSSVDNSGLGSNLADSRSEANQAPHMNVYKPTFIVHFCKTHFNNYALANDIQSQEQRDAEMKRQLRNPNPKPLTSVS